MARPRNDHSLSGPTEMGRHLLGPLEGRVKCPRPRNRHVRVGLLRSPVFVMQQLQRLREGQDAVVGRHLVKGSLQSAFGARAVVAANVDNERVVELALILNFLNDPANLMVGIGDISSENLSLARVEFLLDQRERIPPRQLCAVILSLPVRPIGKLGARRDHAEPLLVRENLLAQLLIAHVKLTLELLDPFLRRLVRRMGASGHVIEEKRLVRRRRVQTAYILDRLVRQIRGEIIAGLADPRKYRGVIAIKVGRPLISLATHEAVEILKAHPRRPLVEWTGSTILVCRGVVVLTKPGGRITVVLQDFAYGGAILAYHGIVTREAGGQFADHAKAD